MPFWLRMTGAVRGPVLELGCGTGRVTMPLAHEGVHVVGVDRSAPMLNGRGAGSAGSAAASPPTWCAATSVTCRSPTAAFQMVIAPYGILQSLLSERDLKATLADVARVVEPDGIFGLELVADLPAWGEYRKRVSLQRPAEPGWRPRHAGGVGPPGPGPRPDDLRPGVRGAEGRHTRRRRFALTFRTLSVPQMTRRLEAAGFRAEAVLGDYQGGPWDPRAEVWIILARKD